MSTEADMKTCPNCGSNLDEYRPVYYLPPGVWTRWKFMCLRCAPVREIQKATLFDTHDMVEAGDGRMIAVPVKDEEREDQ